MSEHTKEPWGLCAHTIVARAGFVLPGADYDRARACVNALAGKNPEWLGRVVEEANEAVRFLRATADTNSARLGGMPKDDPCGKMSIRLSEALAALEDKS